MQNHDLHTPRVRLDPALYARGDDQVTATFVQAHGTTLPIDAITGCRLSSAAPTWPWLGALAALGVAWAGFTLLALALAVGACFLGWRAPRRYLLWVSLAGGEQRLLRTLDPVHAAGMHVALVRALAQREARFRQAVAAEAEAYRAPPLPAWMARDPAWQPTTIDDVYETYPGELAEDAGAIDIKLTD